MSNLVHFSMKSHYVLIYIVYPLGSLCTWGFLSLIVHCMEFDYLAFYSHVQTIGVVTECFCQAMLSGDLKFLQFSAANSFLFSNSSLIVPDLGSCWYLRLDYN